MTTGRLGTSAMESWAIYCAFCPMTPTSTLVKVGISLAPIQRLFQVHCGSPFALKEALWMYVGTKRQALIAERFAHRMMMAKKTRGEWLQFDLTAEADKRLFHDTMHGALHRAVSKDPSWNRVTLSQVKEALGIEEHFKR